MIFSKGALSRIMKEMRVARSQRHRRLVVLTGNNDGNLIAGAAELVEAYVTRFGLGEYGVLYAYHAFYEDGMARREMFERIKPKELEVEFVPYHECTKVLGRTYQVAILDLVNNLEPNDLGKLMGIVNGGGFYIFLIPELETYTKVVTRFHTTLATPQYGVDKVRHLFVRRFIKKLFEFDGICIYDVDRKEFLKEFRAYEAGRAREGEPEVPEKSVLPRVAYRLALTQDQVEVLKLLESLYEKVEDSKIAIVVTADRGRGKSSVIGIGMGALAHKLRRTKGRCRIIVTAPSETNVQELLRFSRVTLERLNHKVEVVEEEGFIRAVRAKGIEIEYHTPLDAVRRKGDILAVDEAASLHVPMLFALLKRYDKVVYSSTIHGYEGAGRGFSIRFLRRLKRDERVRVLEYEMTQPIRYAENDPVERWAFDTLLLDAEPARLDEEDMKMVENLDVEYYVPDLEEFFLKREDLLRQFIGIYIMAHYRNNPNDLGMMMDAPHHTVRALMLRSGKIVVSVELAEEGPLEGELARESAKGAWIMGNIIPDRIIKHYKLIDFGRFRGLRIVRIATHPDVMSRGLGSEMLRRLEEEARERGYDWIGAGFGITFELLKFWLKNGYVPVHLSPDRNPVSGEYSVLVIKPLNEKVGKYIELIAWEFKRKLLNSLPEPYHDLHPRVVKMLLESTPSRRAVPSLSVYQAGRLISYAWGDMTLENCMDCVTELAKTHFMDSERVELSELQTLLLITRVLQAKSWRVTCEELNLTPPKAMDELRAATRKMVEKYLGIQDEKDLEKYLYLTLE